MAIYKEDIATINLETGNIFRSFVKQTIGTADNAADRFGIRVMRGDTEVDLSGCSCYGYFKDPHGNNIALTSYGTIDGNVAYVTLPQACYNYEGQFCLAIKLIGGGVTGTMRIVDGVIDNTNTGSAAAPTEAVPTYQEILSQYDAMVAATAAANGCIADTFDATKVYKAGQYVISSGSLYRLTADHAANVTWANTSKVAVKFGNELYGTKKSAIIDNNYNYLVEHPFNDTTSNQVSFTQNADGSVTVRGTVNGSSAYGYFFNASNKYPPFIVPGKSYHIDFSGDKVQLRLSYYDTSWHVFLTTKVSTDFTAPNSFVGFRIQLFVSGNGTVVDETVYPKIVEIKPEAQRRFERNNIGAASESAFSSIEESSLEKTNLVWFLGKNVGSSGSVQNNSAAALTGNIPVSRGTQIQRIGDPSDSNGKTLFVYVNAYENMVFKDRTILYKFDVYTVPDGVDSVCFGFARAAEQGVDMSTSDIETYFGVKWHFATESNVSAEQIPNSGKYIDNLFEKFCSFGSGSSNGIYFDLVDEDTHSYYVHGATTDAAAFYNLYNGLIPGCIERGKSYEIFYENSSEARNCHVRFLFYDVDGNYTQGTSYGSPYPVTIPDNAFTMIVRLYVAKNMNVDTTIKYLKLVEVQDENMLIPYIISFVDDDASGDTYVERYYNSCKRNGINGNYAVITNYWGRGATDPETLLEYEDDGMGMLIHCSEQSYSLAPEWMDRDYDGCRKNLFKGMRAMAEAGFVNFKYWVMPYGYVNDDFKKLAQDAGMKCMISSANFTYNRNSDSDRYFIKRYSLNPTDENPDSLGALAKVKEAIDNMFLLPSCWLIITTHFNEWGSVTWDSTVDETGYPVGYERMNEIIQYAKASGAAVLTVPEAWRFYEPIIEANEQRYNKIQP